MSEARDRTSGPAPERDPAGEVELRAHRTAPSEARDRTSGPAPERDPAGEVELRAHRTAPSEARDRTSGPAPERDPAGEVELRAHPIGVDTVEALVRHRLSRALGGRRGMLEAGIPGIVFTAIWLIFSELQAALVASLTVALVALAVRLVQRSTVQYVFNALFAIGIGWVFVRIAANAGGSETDQALAFFLPGILYSAAYTIVMGATCLAGWPLLGFMLGAATEDPLGWHEDKQIVRLCSRLTWVMLAPGAIGALLQGPVWVMGHLDVIDPDLAVLLIVILRMGLGWALRIGAFALMIWLLARNATPLAAPSTSSAERSQPG